MLFNIKTKVSLKNFVNGCSLIFNEPWALANKIMLNIMQNFKSDFLENEFWLTGMYVSSSISRTLHNFSTGFFSMYREILELKHDMLAFCRKMVHSHTMYFGLAALFVKTKIYFYHCNFVSKQISKSSCYCFLYRH